jgi:hypothetical protein
MGFFVQKVRIALFDETYIICQFASQFTHRACLYVCTLELFFSTQKIE